MDRIILSRTARIPDTVRLARYSKAPELGPKLLFFSGGTALNSLSRELIGYTHNSIHLVTPFDSGGSSRALRKAFNMPAVGDARSRLMALADQSVTGAPDVYRLFAYRFPKDGDSDKLLSRLIKMAEGKEPLVSSITDPMRKIIRSHLSFFIEKAPKDFDLRGASVGNLILAGGYLNYGRRFDPVIFLFSKLVESRGVVRPIVGDSLHLSAHLKNGSVIRGQHLITGKEAPPISSPIKSLCLIKSEKGGEPASVTIREKTRELIRQAELICYPMGSYYTSLLANLLPKGVGSAVAQSEAPKIYIPSTGNDPEQIGMTLSGAVRGIISALRKSAGNKEPASSLVNYVLIDSKNGSYAPALDLASVRKSGVKVIDEPLVTERGNPHLDPERVIKALLSLV